MNRSMTVANNSTQVRYDTLFGDLLLNFVLMASVVAALAAGAASLNGF